jgi:hypothetical protein
LLPVVEEFCAVRRCAVKGEDPASDIFEDGRTIGESGDLVDDVLGRRSFDREGAKYLMHGFAELKLFDLGVHDDRVDCFSDSYERNFGVQCDEWQVVSFRALDESGGKSGKPSTEFDDDPGGPSGCEIADVASEPSVRGRKRYARG